MYEVIPCNGDCFNCPYPDCIVSKPFRTPFEAEQAQIRAEKEAARRKAAAEKAKADAAFARWLRKNKVTGRGWLNARG